MTSSSQSLWGRVDETLTVFVKTDEGERAVGQYPDVTPEEALAFFERRYTDLSGQIGLLEVRVRKGAPANEIAKAVAVLREKVAVANAVGDLALLEKRLDALIGVTEELTEQQKLEAKKLVAKAIVEREALIAKVEALAAKDPAKTQWKTAGAEMDKFFADWQSHQQSGTRLPRSEANALWQRFRAARTTFEQHRRQYFHELDQAHRGGQEAKERLITKAVALAKRGADGLIDYKALLDEWKKAPRAAHKVEDQLWERFKAAGDVLYSARAELNAKENAEFEANLVKKLALLDEAQPLLQATNPKPARQLLNRIQKQWDEIGKIPRDKIKSVDDKINAIDSHIRSLESDRWQREDPEKKARSEGMVSQLQGSILKLKDELATAEKSGNTKAAAEAKEALQARESWLRALSK